MWIEKNERLTGFIVNVRVMLRGLLRRFLRVFVVVVVEQARHGYR
jgi:hypothetical protein